MAESELTVRSMKKREENKQFSPYLSGFYQKNIPWWPFVVFGIITAIALGATINIDLGFSHPAKTGNWRLHPYHFRLHQHFRHPH
jgi:hypothetical protein